MNLLLSAGADVNTQDHNGGTALHRAVSYGVSEIVKLFLAAGRTSTGKIREDRRCINLFFPAACQRYIYAPTQNKKRKMLICKRS